MPRLGKAPAGVGYRDLTANTTPRIALGTYQPNCSTLRNPRIDPRLFLYLRRRSRTSEKAGTIGPRRRRVSNGEDQLEISIVYD